MIGRGRLTVHEISRVIGFRSFSLSTESDVQLSNGVSDPLVGLVEKGHVNGTCGTK